MRADLTSLSSWESSFKLSLERCIDPIWGARQSGLDSAGVLLSGAPSLETEAESGSPSPLAHAGSGDARGWGGALSACRAASWGQAFFAVVGGGILSVAWSLAQRRASPGPVLKASPLHERGF